MPDFELITKHTLIAFEKNEIFAEAQNL